MTHLEFMVYVRWLADQWNEPNRHDWYAMQTAAEIRQIRYSFSKTARGVKIKDLKLPFVTAGQREAVSPEEAEAQAKRAELAWLARLNLIGPGAKQPLVKREPKPKAGGAVKPVGMKAKPKRKGG